MVVVPGRFDRAPNKSLLNGDPSLGSGFRLPAPPFDYAQGHARKTPQLGAFGKAQYHSECLCCRDALMISRASRAK
jgi:hypothetical protein